MEQISGYKIIEEIGKGGMATVYKARQEVLERDIAIKIMLPSLCTEDSFKERFLKEGKTIAQLSHSNIITIHDIGCDNDNYYLAMEYLNGGDLKTKIRSSSLDQKQIITITKQIAAALGFAHEKGFVHRDVKPENILFKNDGQAVLTDFGIVKIITAEKSLTVTGTSIGTLYYMSPEQSRAIAIDGRSDLYSLGVVLYEMLTGKVPFSNGDALAIAYSHVNDPVPPLPSEYKDFQIVMDKLLSKEPEGRFQNAEELISVLDKIERGEVINAKTIISGSQPKVESKNSQKNKLFIVASLGILLLLTVVSIYFVIQDDVYTNVNKGGVVEGSSVIEGSQIIVSDPGKIEEHDNQETFDLDELYFPDPNLAKCFKNQAATNNWKQTGEVNGLECNNFKIKDVTGIEKLHYLFVLTMNDNEIEEIDLSHFPELRFFGLKGNKLKKIDISHNPKLGTFDLGDNQISEIIIGDNSMLKAIMMPNNKLEYIDFAGATSLETILLINNNLKEIDIADLEVLKSLQLSNNHIMDIDLEKNSYLEYLDISNNQLTEIRFPKDTVLEGIRLKGNELDKETCSYLSRFDFVDHFFASDCEK